MTQLPPEVDDINCECPDVVPIIPISGAILLPRAQIPLNIFEERYLSLTDDVLKGDRLIGIIQPLTDETSDSSDPPLQNIGCVGRITQFAETGDGRYLITLTGVSRFKIVKELNSSSSYRLYCVDYSDFKNDRIPRTGEEDVDRASLIDALKRYTDISDFQLDWHAIAEAPNEALVNALSLMSPFGIAEKQALLEAEDLKTRSELLVAMTEIELAKSGANIEKTLQ